MKDLRPRVQRAQVSDGFGFPLHSFQQQLAGRPAMPTRGTNLSRSEQVVPILAASAAKRSARHVQFRTAGAANCPVPLVRDLATLRGSFAASTARLFSAQRPGAVAAFALGWISES